MSSSDTSLEAFQELLGRIPGMLGPRAANLSGAWEALGRFAQAQEKFPAQYRREYFAWRATLYDMLAEEREAASCFGRTETIRRAEGLRLVRNEEGWLIRYLQIVAGLGYRKTAREVEMAKAMFSALEEVRSPSLDAARRLVQAIAPTEPSPP